MQMATSRAKVEAGLAETAAHQALATEAEAEDKSRVADVKVARAASLVAKYQTTLALRLRWAKYCERRAGRTDWSTGWHEEFIVPEEMGAKVSESCRQAKARLNLCLKQFKETVSALACEQQTAHKLAVDWHATLHDALRASLQRSASADMAEYSNHAAHAVHEDTARVEQRLEMEIRLGREGGLMGGGLKGAGYGTPFLMEFLAENGLDAGMTGGKSQRHRSACKDDGGTTPPAEVRTQSS